MRPGKGCDIFLDSSTDLTKYDSTQFTEGSLDNGKLDSLGTLIDISSGTYIISKGEWRNGLLIEGSITWAIPLMLPWHPNAKNFYHICTALLSPENEDNYLMKWEGVFVFHNSYGRGSLQGFGIKKVFHPNSCSILNTLSTAQFDSIVQGVLCNENNTGIIEVYDDACLVMKTLTTHGINSSYTDFVCKDDIMKVSGIFNKGDLIE